MYDLLGPGTILGYCTNVHPGGTLQELHESLTTRASAVRRIVCPHDKLPIGLWLSAEVLHEMLIKKGTRTPAELLRSWLDPLGLEVFTFNGFPYGDFQGKVVKHAVYMPNWLDPQRNAYTITLFKIMSELLPTGRSGSISTLPLKWGVMKDDVEEFRHLSDAVASAGRDVSPKVHLDFEPEPGCAWQHPSDVVAFLGDMVNSGECVPDPKGFRAAVRVCHDICHAAVMFDKQRASLRAYADGHVSVGKVQISSALRVRFDTLSSEERQEARRQLLPFAEDRYLHQTMIRQESGELKFFEDLPFALAAAGDEPRGEWRIHYHVPIFLDRIGLLETTNDEIPAAIKAARELHDVKHFEVETYAWNVLPKGVWQGTVEEGIARELLWVKENVPKWLAPSNP